MSYKQYDKLKYFKYICIKLKTKHIEEKLN